MSILDPIMRAISGATKQGAYDYCHLETADDDKVFVTKDGDFLTVIEMKGTLSVVGKQEFARRLDEMYSRMQGILAKPGYRIQIVFVRDTENAEREATEAILPSMDTVKRMRLDFKEALIERRDVLAARVAREACYLVITTTTAILPPTTVKQAMQSRNENSKKHNVGVKMGAHGQNPTVAIKEIRQAHSTFVSKMASIMNSYVSISIMEVHNALRAIRMEIDPEFTSRKWRASLPGDPIQPRLMSEGNDHDLSHVQWPAIGWQLFPRDAEVCEEDASIIRIGNRYTAPLMVDIPPQEPKPFMELFNSIGNEIPWRFSMTIETGHQAVLSKVSTKSGFASMLAFAGAGNKLIKEGVREFIRESKDGWVLARASISLATWGDSVEEADRRRNILAQAVQSWGYIDVITEKGDPFGVYVNTLPAVGRRPIGTVFPVNLMEAFAYIPITRPTSPWPSGSMLFRSIDSKLYPFQPGSSRQTMWIDLIFARPGSGKSVLLSALNTALLTAPGNLKLPRIGNIDIGHSSAAWCEMVRDMLPPELQHQVAHYRLRMTKEYAINPFDTPLGCRYPLAVDRSFLINFVTLLLTPIGSGTIASMPELVSQMVDSMYKYFEDTQRPYERYVDSVVDKAIEDNSITFEYQNVTWWEVVDELFNKGLVHEAGMAQRYAVPTLADASTVLNQDTTIRDVYRETTIPGGEGLIQAAGRMLSAVMKDYPILASPSMFDMGSARIVALDLAEVAKTGGDAADRQTAVMYMMARYILCREFYRDLDSLMEIPELYNDHHKRIIEEEMQSPKKICFDEFHRTYKSQMVREQVVVDMREGRKFNVQIALVSQREQDFNEDMVNLATNIFILDKGTEQTQKNIAKIFGPSDDAMRGLRTHVNGPGPGGSNFLYIGNIKGGGLVNQILNFSLGPIELWAYSTTVEDVALRRKMAGRIGLTKSLTVLAKHFPGGSAKAAIEERKLELASNSDSEDDEAMRRIIDDFAENLAAEAGKDV